LPSGRDTFTTDATNSKRATYVIELPVENLDLNGGFKVIRVGVGNAVATTLCVTYIPHTNNSTGSTSEPNFTLN